MKLVIKKPNNWPILQNNKKIYVISPAYCLQKDEIQDISDFLANWGVEGIFYHPQEKSKLGFLENSDNDRLNELKNALYGDQSEIIFCARGGYGSARILKELLKLEKPKESKLLIGFSDITSLHLAFNNYFNISTLHAPMLRSLSNGKIDQLSIKFFHNILTTKTIELSYDITAFNKLAQKVDNLTLPKLLGGNLSLIQTSIGTNWQIKQNNDYCLLIEDVDEEAYSIDRMLNHLENANIIKNCKAIFIGDVDVVDVNDKKDLNQVLKTFADNLHIPIFRINNIGHQKTNLGIPLGVNVAINA